MKNWVFNREIFSSSSLRQDALKILETGLSAVDTRTALAEKLKWNKENRTLEVENLSFRLNEFKNVYLIAIGKCAVNASKVVEDILGDELTDGIVLDVQEGVSERLKIRKGTHPFPSDLNVDATKEILDLLARATEKDLVLSIISGGGSALLSSPHEISHETLSLLTKELMGKGATIEEINTVRKHLSEAQGGQLAKIAFPATIVGLFFSDVIGDDLSVIASGPLTKDKTTIADAQNILIKYNLPQYKLLETPKEDKYFEKVNTVLVVNSQRALLVMKKEATNLGYSAKIETLEMRGEAKDVGAELGKRKIAPKSAVLLAGETTVKIKNPAGEGGRNMELTLSALIEIQEADFSNKLIISLASDGRDNSDFAGAIADIISIVKTKELGLNPEEFLENNNSKKFWEKNGNQIITGSTGINVADFVLMLNE